MSDSVFGDDKVSGLVIVFDAPNSVQLAGLTMQNVSSMQLAALIMFLETEAKSRMAEEREMRKVAVPKKPQILTPGR